jgi:hypothetical protein
MSFWGERTTSHKHVIDMRSSDRLRLELAHGTHIAGKTLTASFGCRGAAIVGETAE